MKIVLKYGSFISGIAIMLSISVLDADTIHLKSGQTVIGRIINQTQTTVEIETDTGRRTIQKSQISRIAYGDPAEEKAAEEKRRQKAEAEKRKAEEEARRAAEEEARRRADAEKKKAEEEAENRRKEAERKEKQDALTRIPQPVFYHFNAGFIRWSPSVMHNAFKVPYVNSLKDTLADNPRASREIYNKMQDGYVIGAGRSHQTGKWDHMFSLLLKDSAADQIRTAEASSLYIVYPMAYLPDAEKIILKYMFQLIPESRVNEINPGYEASYNPFRLNEGSSLRNLAFTAGIGFRFQDLRQHVRKYNHYIISENTDDYTRRTKDLFYNYPELGRIRYSEGFIEFNAGIRYKYEFSPKAIFDIAGGLGAGAGRYYYKNDPGLFRYFSLSTLLSKEVRAKGDLESEGSYLSLGYGFRLKEHTARLFYSKSFTKSKLTSAKLKDPSAGVSRAFLPALYSDTVNLNAYLLEFISLPQLLPGTVQEENKIGFEFRYRYQ